jgi:T-complex protein 1 subunit theta
MVINHLEKLFVTSDAATVIKEVEVHHPAAKMIAMASCMQERESGDGTNFVISLAGELMTQAESLLKMGLHPSEILIGYEKGSKKCLEILEGLVCHEVKTLKEKDEVVKCIKTSIASKQYGLEEFLASKIADCCMYAMPRNLRNFNVDNIRVQKILGGGIHDSVVIHGMVCLRGSETSTTSVQNAKIAVFNTSIEM